jgi:hypothetical protein
MLPLRKLMGCTPPSPDGRYVDIMWVPTVFGKFACAYAMNSGAGNVTNPPALDDDLRASTAK